ALLGLGELLRRRRELPREAMDVLASLPRIGVHPGHVEPRPDGIATQREVVVGRRRSDVSLEDVVEHGAQVLPRYRQAIRGRRRDERIELLPWLRIDGWQRLRKALT